VDRRAHHGGSRRCRFRLSRQARRAHAGGDKVRQSHPPLLRRAWNRRLPHCREPRRDRGRARVRGGRAHRRHHHHRRDARRQRAQDPGRRNDPALAGDADRLAHRPLGGECAASRTRHPRAHRGERRRDKITRSPGAPAERFGAVSATGEDVDPHGFVALHCARGKVAELAGWLLTQGAERVSVAALEQTFAARNALYETLERRIGACER
jgi:hypothetical protein